MSRACILAVDDTPTSLRLVADLLEAAGHAVATARSGPEALARIAAERIDLVLLDVVMPAMSGYEVCRAIRENPTTTMLPVVMVTALDTIEERVRGLEAGADEFLVRPFHPPELLARVRSLLRLKHLYDTVDDQARQLRDGNARLERRVSEQVAQLERLATLRRFLPPAVVARVEASSGEDMLRRHRCEIVVAAIALRDPIGSTEQAAPEDALAILQDHHAAIGALAAEHEGTLERFTSDGATVFFNDPTPQPDAPARAARFALDVRAAAATLAARWRSCGVALELGVGIAQGYATLGAVGTASRSDYVAIGAVTRMAARLAEAAPPSEVLLTERVVGELGTSIATEPAGELTLRGFDRPVPARRLLAPTAAAGPADGAAPGGTVAGATVPTALPARTFVREGEYWTLQFDGPVVRLRDAKGLRYLAHLLRHPECDHHALDLVAVGRADGADAPPTDATAATLRAFGDAGPSLDEQAKAAYRRRLGDLRGELVEAEAFGDAGRVTALRFELEALSNQLAAAVGLGGRDRPVASAAERARVSVTRAISDALKRIREHDAPLARHLEASVRTGTFCAYRPAEGGIAWRL